MFILTNVKEESFNPRINDSKKSRFWLKLKMNVGTINYFSCHFFQCVEKQSGKKNLSSSDIYLIIELVLALVSITKCSEDMIKAGKLGTKMFH